MTWLIEKLMGLESGFLSREGELALRFGPRWPLAEVLGHAVWNLLFTAVIVLVVWWVYRREVRARKGAAWLAILRGALMLLVLILLNRPSVELTTHRVEPSVLAVLLDESQSMSIADAGTPDLPKSRLDAARELLIAGHQSLVAELAKTHQLRFYAFGDRLRAIAQTDLDKVEPVGTQTRLSEAIHDVCRELAGQRVAGVLVLTDGRSAGEGVTLTDIRRTDLPRVFAVPLGTSSGLSNLSIEQIVSEDAVFAGDLANIKARIRGSGVSGDKAVTVRLLNADDQPVLDPGGNPIKRDITFPVDGVQEVELQFIPRDVGERTLRVKIDGIVGEIDPRDNQRDLRLSVVESTIAVLYVDGYPRWEYRYLRQEFIRDKTIDVSLLLTSADVDFAQEGDRPITRFPLTLDEIKSYDVILLGDIDPRQFTDAQLALMEEFVNKLGGGFGMIAGPRYTPHAYRNTPIEALIPVDISRAGPSRATNLTRGFRPVLTPAGSDGGIFRFLPDRDANEAFLRDTIQPVFWFAPEVTVKPGVAQVLAQHPAATSGDGRPTPLVVTARYGAGRTLFVGIDETWRWRFYTGESIFNSFWVQSMRFLVRGRKLGQRQVTLALDRPSYQIGEQVRLVMRVPDPKLAEQLPSEVSVQMLDSTGGVIGEVRLARSAADSDQYIGSFTADRAGSLTVRLQALAGTAEVRLPVEVSAPRVEFEQPQVDRTLISRLAAESDGKVVEAKDASTLTSLITSRQEIIPQRQSRLLWNSPLVFASLLGLITLEWLGRKWAGLL